MRRYFDDGMCFVMHSYRVISMPTDTNGSGTAVYPDIMINTLHGYTVVSFSILVVVRNFSLVFRSYLRRRPVSLT